MGTSEPLQADRTNAHAALYAAAASELGGAAGVPVLDLHALLQRQPGWQRELLVDGLHFTPAGQAFVGRQVIGALADAFPDLRCARTRATSRRSPPPPAPAPAPGAHREAGCSRRGRRAPPLGAGTRGGRSGPCSPPALPPSCPASALRRCPTTCPGGEALRQGHTSPAARSRARRSCAGVGQAARSTKLRPAAPAAATQRARPALAEHPPVPHRLLPPLPTARHPCRDKLAGNWPGEWESFSAAAAAAGNSGGSSGGPRGA